MAAIAKTTIETSVGIYNNCEVSIRVHADRTLVRQPYVKWIGNTGGYAEKNYRITGAAHEKMLEAIRKAAADEIDPDDYIQDVYRELCEQYYFA